MAKASFHAHAANALLLIVAAFALSACGGNPTAPADVTITTGFDIREWATGFDGPTQMILLSDGDVLIAELNGPENDGNGRVLRVSADDPSERVVLQTGLDKPTGIAVAGEVLWIMEADRLTTASLTVDAPRQVFADELPSNGRSQGTLTLTPRDQLLFDTSGSKRGPDRVAGSGTLFALENASSGSGTPGVVATGFKHAYAHVIDTDGQLWSVEMTDGNFDDQRASDELIAITIGDDAGWPQCVDDNRPVVEYGGSAELCASSPSSHALFGVGATPTSIVVAPWDPALFVVALWLPGEVVTIPVVPGTGPHEPTVFIDGIESPQHLLAFDGGLLVSDHETGTIYHVRPN